MYTNHVWVCAHSDMNVHTHLRMCLLLLATKFAANLCAHTDQMRTHRTPDVHAHASGLFYANSRAFSEYACTVTEYVRMKTCVHIPDICMCTSTCFCAVCRNNLRLNMYVHIYLLTLIGEPPSSWPALTSNPNPKLESPDHPPHHHSPSPPPAAADSPNTTPDLFSSSASSSSDPSSHDDAVAVTVAAAVAVSPAVPPPAPAPVLPVSPRNADQPRISASHHRRGRNPRFQNHRGGGGSNGSPRSNNSYGNRAPAPGWRPNWGGFTPVPQYPNWGFFPGSAVGVGVVPPADYFVPYPQHFNEMVYPDYGMSVEAYGAYYGQPAYEVQYAPQMNPAVAGMPSPPSLGFTVDHELEALKTRLIFQIEYYFSDENLAKDTFLRNQMDNQGWVDILAITPFKRVVALVDEFKKKDSLVEAVSLIKDTLQSSNVVEFQGNKMRKRIGWHKWIIRETPSPKQLVTGMRSIKLED